VIKMEIGEKDINELINSLNDVDYDVRNSVEDILVKIGDPVIEHLIKALKHDDPEIRVESARILGIIGDRRGLKPLILALKDENVKFRKEATISINKILDKNE
jgi:HEAT repeat protein